jgi:hypothetical protein
MVPGTVELFAQEESKDRLVFLFSLFRGRGIYVGDGTPSNFIPVGDDGGNA